MKRSLILPLAASLFWLTASAGVLTTGSSLVTTGDDASTALTNVVFPKSVTADAFAATNTTTDIYTVPAGKHFILTSAVFSIASVTGTTAANPSWQIVDDSGNSHTNASSTGGTALTTVGWVKLIPAVSGSNQPVAIPAGGKIQAKIITNPTGASAMTCNVFVVGFLY